jgi:hypothetical protein
MGIADIITDTLLVIFPISILMRSAMPVMRRIRLSLLFSLNGILICITAFRIMMVIEHHGRQQTRTVYASGEILAAAAASNAVILGSFLRDRGVKKAKYKTSQTDSVEGPSSRRMTLTKQAYGSDLDLFHGMCYRTSHDDPEAGVPRAPPIMSGANGEDPAEPNEESSLRADDGWRRPSNNSSYQKTSRHVSRSRSRNNSNAAQSEPSKLVKTVTFSDPGGLLDNASSQASTSVAAPSSLGQASAAQDFGGSMAAMGRRWSRGRQASIAEGSPQAESSGMPDRARSGSASQFKDVGGLLE